MGVTSPRTTTVYPRSRQATNVRTHSRESFTHHPSYAIQYPVMSQIRCAADRLLWILNVPFLTPTITAPFVADWLKLMTEVFGMAPSGQTVTKPAPPAGTAATFSATAVAPLGTTDSGIENVAVVLAGRGTPGQILVSDVRVGWIG